MRKANNCKCEDYKRKKHGQKQDTQENIKKGKQALIETGMLKYKSQYTFTLNAQIPNLVFCPRT
jgi:hypothetical protein